MASTSSAVRSPRRHKELVPYCLWIWARALSSPGLRGAGVRMGVADIDRLGALGWEGGPPRVGRAHKRALVGQRTAEASGAVRSTRAEGAWQVAAAAAR